MERNHGSGHILRLCTACLVTLWKSNHLTRFIHVSLFNVHVQQAAQLNDWLLASYSFHYHVLVIWLWHNVAKGLSYTFWVYPSQGLFTLGNHVMRRIVEYWVHSAKKYLSCFYRLWFYFLTHMSHVLLKQISNMECKIIQGSSHVRPRDRSLIMAWVGLEN